MIYARDAAAKGFAQRRCKLCKKSCQVSNNQSISLHFSLTWDDTKCLVTKYSYKVLNYVYVFNVVCMRGSVSEMKFRLIGRQLQNGY